MRWIASVALLALATVPAAADWMVAHEIAGLKSASPEKRARAVEALGKMGPRAEDALPALVAAAREKDATPEFVDRVLIAHANIAGDAPKDLFLALLDGNHIPPPLFCKSARATEFVRAFPQLAARHLLAVVADENPRRRRQVVGVLGLLLKQRKTSHDAKSPQERLGPVYPDVLAALVERTTDVEIAVRAAATIEVANQHVGPDIARKLLPEALRLLRVQQFVGDIVGLLVRPLGVEALPALVAEFDGPAHRRDVARAIRFVEEPAIALLKETLTSADAKRRAGAATALVEFDRHDAEVGPLLVPLAKDASPVVRFCAAEGLLTIHARRRGAAGTTPEGEAAVAALAALLGGPDATLKRDAVTLLERVRPGSAAKPAIPALRAALADADREFARTAAYALLNADRAQAEHVVALLAADAAELATASHRAIATLGDLGAVAKPALPKLRTLFAAQAPQYRIAAAEAVAKIDPTLADEALAVLLPMLTAADGANRPLVPYAAAAIGHLGPAAKPALDPLGQLLADPKTSDRATVALALVGIAPDHAAARAFLKIAFANPDDDALGDILEALHDSPGLSVALIPELSELLKAKAPYLRRRAATIFRAAGPAAAAALPALRAALAAETNVGQARVLKETIAKIEEPTAK